MTKAQLEAQLVAMKKLLEAQGVKIEEPKSTAKKAKKEVPQYVKDKVPHWTARTYQGKRFWNVQLYSFHEKGTEIEVIVHKADGTRQKVLCKVMGGVKDEDVSIARSLGVVETLKD